jgi:hypothetical protein
MGEGMDLLIKGGRVPPLEDVGETLALVCWFSKRQEEGRE